MASEYCSRRDVLDVIDGPMKMIAESVTRAWTSETWLYMRMWVWQSTPIPSLPETGAMAPVEDPRAGSHPQRANPPVTGTLLPPPVIILHNDLHMSDISSVEPVSNIRSFIHSSPRIAAARNLRGKEAQGLVDLIDQVSSAQLLRGVI